MKSAAKIKTLIPVQLFGRFGLKSFKAFELHLSFQVFKEDKRGQKLILTRAKPENQKPKTVSQTVKCTLSVSSI